MNITQPLLSICIPTYNRAKILEATLTTFVNDDAFDESVEIIISDNCSTDETQIIGQKYSAKYPNIKYNRNKENVRDKNFFLVMGLASGKYIKLINDTVTFKKGKLRKMKSCLINADASRHLLFPAVSAYSKTNVKNVSSPDELIKYVSFNITWLSTYGMWKADYETICFETDDFTCQLMQVEWLLRLAKQKNFTLYFDDYYDVFETKNKGTYNVFSIFTDNYFKILRNNISHRYTYEREKYRVFTKFIVPLVYNSLIPGNKLTWDYSGLKSCYKRHYWYCLYAIVYIVAYFPARFVRDFIAGMK